MTRGDGPALELGEGFGGEQVVVLVDGRAVWQGPARTNWSVGLAEVVGLPAGSTLEVRVAGTTTRAALPPGARLRADRAPDGAVRLGAAPTGPLL